MKLLHIVPHINEEAAGPSYSVPRLCESLSDAGHNVQISCLAARSGIRGVSLNIYPQWPVLSRFAVSPRLAIAVQKQSRKVDVIHNHSLWAMPNVVAGYTAGHGSRLVTSPRGTLSAWSLQRSRRKKALLWPFQKRALFNADLIHVTSLMELGEVRDLACKAPVAVIPNGIDIPPLFIRAATPARRRLLFLSRIHPKKGVYELLSAWKTLRRKHVEWELVIAGTGEPMHVERLRSDLMNVEGATFVGPVYGAAKTSLYYSADLFVLPTYSENFGMVVAEALAHGCPAVVTKGAPWSGLITERSGWWIDGTVDSLSSSLDAAMTTEAGTLKQMGLNGRAWMKREFGWTGIAEQMSSAYRWIVEGGAVPPTVHV